MRKIWIVMLSIVLLTGCGKKEALETVSDVMPVTESAPVGKLSVSLPEDAAADAMESEDGAKLYQCDGYQVMIQTMASGDLERTLLEVSGCGKEDLTLMKTDCQGHERYDWVFAATGESGDQVFRCALLDDGNYHYVVTAMAPAETAGQLSDTWNELFGSVCLSNTD